MKRQPSKLLLSSVEVKQSSDGRQIKRCLRCKEPFLRILDTRFWWCFDRLVKKAIFRVHFISFPASDGALLPERGDPRSWNIRSGKDISSHLIPVPHVEMEPSRWRKLPQLLNIDLPGGQSQD